jgi:hypothetical protein
MSSRASRVSALRDTAKQYIAAEKKRIENEVSTLEAVLRGRTGGAGVQLKGIEVAKAAAENDLAAFLKEG